MPHLTNEFLANWLNRFPFFSRIKIKILTDLINRNLIEVIKHDFGQILSISGN